MIFGLETSADRVDSLEHVALTSRSEVLHIRLT